MKDKEQTLFVNIISFLKAGYVNDLTGSIASVFPWCWAVPPDGTAFLFAFNAYQVTFQGYDIIFLEPFYGSSQVICVWDDMVIAGVYVHKILSKRRFMLCA